MYVFKSRPVIIITGLYKKVCYHLLAVIEWVFGSKDSIDIGYVGFWPLVRPPSLTH